MYILNEDGTHWKQVGPRITGSAVASIYNIAMSGDGDRIVLANGDYANIYTLGVPIQT